jgi:hypothetical protein
MTGHDPRFHAFKVPRAGRVKLLATSINFRSVTFDGLRTTT